jgi:hypothetical protein
MSDNEIKPSRMTRALNVSGDGRPRTYLGKRPAPAVAIAEARDRCPEIASQLSPGELKFLAHYFAEGTLTRAMRKIRPKASEASAAQLGSRMYKAIKERIGQDAIWELMGVSYGAIGRVVRDALSAEYQKDFVVRDGTIVSTEPRPDHQTRLQAAQMGAKLRKLADENEGGGVTVNIIRYNPENTPPWPGAIPPRGFPKDYAETTATLITNCDDGED